METGIETQRSESKEAPETLFIGENMEEQKD